MEHQSPIVQREKVFSTDGAAKSDLFFLAAAKFRNVSKIFNSGIEAVAGFDLDVSQGERVSLLGPSGCGKSTLLRILAGLETASGGDVICAARDRGALGFVFQNPTLLPWKSVFDNIWTPLQLQGQSRAASRDQIMRLLQQVELDGFADALPATLSGGMQMRVSIARALVTDPDILLMDEPFAALDEMTRHRLNDLLLKRQARDGFALLFVTHSVFESVYLCDRVAVMTPRPGRLFGSVDTSTMSERNADYRTSRGFIDRCRAVSDMLRGAAPQS